MTVGALSVERQRALELADLARLAAKFSHYPLLSLEDERSLVTKMHVENDREAAQKLILSHMRYVISVAKGYVSYGIPVRDLVQEGTVGLMKAVRNFQLDHGVRLVTYAAHWIKAEIQEYILKNWRMVKIATTKAQRKLFFNLRKLKKGFGWLNQEETARIAKELAVPEHEVATMELRLAQPEDTYDELFDEDEGKPIGPGYRLSYDGDNPLEIISEDKDKASMLDRLQPALEKLAPRERAIIAARYMQEEKKSLKDLAEEHGVSLERIRQLEVKALTELRQHLGNS